MSKIVLEDVRSGYNLSAINTNMDRIEKVINEDMLSRANVGNNPNEMEVDLDMNGKRIYNLPAPVLPHEAARLKDVTDAISGDLNASLVSFEPYEQLTSTSVQGAIQQLYDKTDTASGIGVVPAGNITSTNVQDALEELDVDIQNSTNFLQNGVGAAPQKLQEKAKDTFAIKDFMIGVTAEDDTKAIQDAINEALRTGRRLQMPVGRTLYITRPILVRVPNTVPPIPYPGPGINLHMSETRAIKFLGEGSWFIKAAPNFIGNEMFRVTYNDNTTSVAPQGTVFQDFSLDGSGIAYTGIISDWCGAMGVKNVRIRDTSVALKYYGYGGLQMNHCTFFGDVGVDFTEGGGDSWLRDNNFYSKNNAIVLGYLGSNCVIDSNVFNRKDADFVVGTRQRGIVYQGSEELRNVRITNNEFCGMQQPIRLIGTGTQNVKKVHIMGNHTIPSAGGQVWTGVLAYLEQAQSCIITGNQIGYMGLNNVAEGELPAIQAVNGRDLHIQGNQFENLRMAAIQAVGIESMSITNNHFRDISTANISNTNIYLEGVTKSVVSCNTATRSNVAFAPTFLQEATGSTNNKGVGNNINGYTTNFGLASGSSSTYS